MDLYRLKVFGAMVLICLAGVNGLDAIDVLPPSDGPTQPQQGPNAHHITNPLHAQSIHGKLLSDIKDETAAKLAPNAANLTEARITSITFRSVDGDADPAAIDRDSGETISFGIRSFTVKVAPAGTEKPIPLGDVVSQNGKPFLLPETIVAAKEPLNVEVLNDRDNVRDQTERFDAQKVPAKSLAGNTGAPSVSESNVFGAAPRTVDAIGHKNEHEHLSISSNGMHVEQKLENGLYRIKIAEIITDEFNNGLNAKHAKEQKLNEIENTIQHYPKPTHTSAQINIADLFPSKLEDFASIIRDSNEKIIREKNRIVGVDNEERVDGSRVNAVDDVSGKHSINKEKQFVNHQKSIPPKTSERKVVQATADTSNGLEKTASESMKPPQISDKETDFTSKLQVNDEMISQIEHSFRESSEPHPPIEPVIMLNKPMQFIERRVKKFDASVRKLPTSTGTLDAIEQRLNADMIDANTISPVDEELNANKGKLARKNKDTASDTVRATKKSTAKTLPTAPPPPPPLAAAMPTNRNSFPTQIFDERNKANGTIGQTPGQHETIMPATLETITANEQEFLFINVNDNRTQRTQIDAGELARMQNARHQIIEDSKRESNDTKASMAKTPSNGMHVYIMHGSDIRSNQTTATNYNDTASKEFVSLRNADRIPLTNQPNANGNWSQPPASPPPPSSLSTATSNTSTAIDAINLAKSNLQLHTSPVQQTSPESITSRPMVAEPSMPYEMPSSTWAPARAHSAVGYMPKAYGRQRGGYDSFALDTECDMQTPIPADATLWRGNETHELNLPTTVSRFYSMCSSTVILYPM